MIVIMLVLRKKPELQRVAENDVLWCTGSAISLRFLCQKLSARNDWDTGLPAHKSRFTCGWARSF